MGFRRWLENEEGFYGQIVRVPLITDSFIHLTLGSRAEKILAAGKLLMNPPFQKFGTDSVDAISVGHGVWVPKVQYTHLKPMPGDSVVAIHFKTNAMPYAAYPEEVKWNTDVPLLQARIISITQAQQLLRNSTEEDFEIQYI